MGYYSGTKVVMMHKWRKDLWAALSGSDPKEMKIYSGGRKIGKSTFAQMWNIIEDDKPKCIVLESYPVDTNKWHTVECIKEVSNWIRQQPNSGKEWFEHIDQNWILDRNKFDISNEFYLMLKLRWGI
jgi:hypothetical protein